MKISQILSAVIIFSVLIIPVQAQGFVNPDDINFDPVPRLLCIIFPSPGCIGSGGTSEEIFPTPNPSQPTPPYATPEVFPTGKPNTPISGCAQPEGNYLCGSREKSLNKCGHCGEGYPADQMYANCTYQNRAETWGTAYGIDIKKQALSSINLPSFYGHKVEWTQYDEANKGNGNSIIRYSGIDQENGDKYIVQFHHSLPGSGIGKGKTALSGTAGAKVCIAYTFKGKKINCNHVHIQVSAEDRSQWKYANRYYCN